jgi:hypothetical protein
MKHLFRLNSGSKAILLITLMFPGCTEKTTDCTINYKTTGNYEVTFYGSQNASSIKSVTEFNRMSLTNIKSAEIQESKNTNEIQRFDNFFSLSVSTISDSIFKIYSIKTTLTIDTVIFNGSKLFFRTEGINHTVAGHSNHEITEIINNKDTLNWMVTTNLNFSLDGQVKGKSNDFLVYYLIDQELSTYYIPEILKAIQNKK